MAILILIVLIEIVCSFFIARATYKSQVKNDYKSPGITAVIVFVLTLAVFLGVTFLLLGAMFQR